MERQVCWSLNRHSRPHLLKIQPRAIDLQLLQPYSNCPCVRATYHHRIHLQIKVIRIDHILDHTLERLPDIYSLFRPDVLCRDADVCRVSVDDLFDRMGIRHLFCNRDLSPLINIRKHAKLT